MNFGSPPSTALCAPAAGAACAAAGGAGCFGALCASAAVAVAAAQINIVNFLASIRGLLRVFEDQIRSASVPCARRKNISPPVNAPAAMTKRNTTEPIVGNADERIALRNKPRRGGIRSEERRVG